MHHVHACMCCSRRAVPQPIDGDLLMPTAPGLGLKFNEETIRRFGVA